MSETKAEYQAEETEKPDPFEWSLDSEDAETNKDLANWAMRKMYLLRQEIALVKAQHAELLTRLNSDLSGSEAFFLPQLEHWAAQQVAEGKRKSLILPYGTVQFRSVKAGVKVADKDAALVYIIENFPDGLIYEIDNAAYKKLAMEYLQDGEMLPGIETTPEHESFSIRFGKEKEE